MAPFRFALLATICAVVMCCAGAVQLLGVNRIVVTAGRINASTTTLAAKQVLDATGQGADAGQPPVEPQP